MGWQADTPNGHGVLPDSFRHNCNQIISSAIGTALFLAASAAVAQQVPPAAEPGTIERQLQRPPAPRATPPIVIPESDRPTPPRGAANIQFVLKNIRLEGNTAFTTAQLQPIWAELVGKRISVARAFEIAADITARYRNEGFILSRAVVPAQEIADGRVEFVIIEGYVDRVTIEGETTGSKSLIQSKIEKIKRSRPLRARDLERYMLLLNDMPGITAQSVLRPSATRRGASDLTIVVEEKSVSGSLTLDNRGSRFLGPFRGQGTLILDNVMGLYESTEFAVVGTNQEELAFGSLTHTQLIGNEGTTLSFSGSVTRTRPGATLKEPINFDVEGNAWSTSVLATHPVIRSRSDNLSLVAGFHTRNTKSTALDSNIGEDRLRWATVGATIDFIDRLRGINLFGLQVAQGLDILNATETGSPNLTRSDGHSDFTKLNANVSREQTLMAGTSLLLAVVGQYAFDPLLASEEFGFGGEFFGRAYDAFEISGDHGIAAKAELRYGTATDSAVLESYQIFFYYDYGRVWNDVANGPDETESAAAIGLGTRLNFSKSVSFSLQAGKPLTRAATTSRDDGKKDWRGFFKLNARF